MQRVAQYDVLVVGAGHAGCEAACAAARMGASVALITLRADRVGEMPCNPAIGGVGKGHLVAEVDALGGIQGWAADRAGLQFKTLNLSRGPAVWGPRAQCDKGRYVTLMRRLVLRLRGLVLIEDEVVGLLDGACGVAGVRLGSGERIAARAVVLSTGTFLGGILHTGGERREGGRFGEQPSLSLGLELARLGLNLRRFKTGTPPRLDRASLDFAAMDQQKGDEVPQPFSWRTGTVRNRAVCWVTRTPELVQRIIEDNLDRSPLFSGRISGVGPRYCPSIEDKVVRFPQHRQHTVFVEPEGLDDPSMYVNGLSTSLPPDVQELVVHAVPGLQRARFLRYGYAVEYDVVGPGQVGAALDVERVPGLWLAGQVLGTSGYEEAAAQGLIAGVNAVLALKGREPFVVGREQGYIGVLIHDMVSKEHQEPYRMFTSRAEHRLVLGVDSARERLLAEGVRLGLVPKRVFHVEQRRWESRRAARARLETETLNPSRETRDEVRRLCGLEIAAPTSWASLLLRPEVDAEELSGRLSALAGLDAVDRRIVCSQLRYTGYLQRSERERDRVRRLRNVAIPASLSLTTIDGIAAEIREQLRKRPPRTLADIEALPGVTPAAVAILAGAIARQTRQQGGES